MTYYLNPYLQSVIEPSLLIVVGDHEPVIEMNRAVFTTILASLNTTIFGWLYPSVTARGLCLGTTQKHCRIRATACPYVASCASSKSGRHYFTFDGDPAGACRFASAKACSRRTWIVHRS
jgi:hypothetical protein